MTDGLAFTNVVMRPRRPSRAPKLPWGKRGRSPRRPFFVQNRSDARLLFMHMSALGLESAYPCAAHEREKITGAPVPLCSPGILYLLAIKSAWCRMCIRGSVQFDSL